MVLLHLQLLPRQTCNTGWSRIWNMKAAASSTAAGKTSTSATSTSLSSAPMSSATWRPSTCTSSTSTFRLTATPPTPRLCPPTTATGRPRRRAALTLPPMATRASTGRCGVAKVSCPRQLPPPVMSPSTASISKQSSWAPATTASLHTGHRHTLITAPTAAKSVWRLQRRLPRPQPPSPAHSVTILTSRAPTITTLTPATRPASTSTLTSTRPGDPTAAPSSTVCPWHRPTAPPPPAGTSRSTPRCLDLKETGNGQGQTL